MDNLENDLDISWIEEHEKDLNIDQLLFKEPANEIELCFIYINKNGIIEYFKKEKQYLRMDNDINSESNDFEKRMISKERVLYLIQKNKWSKMNDNGINKKYKLIDLLLFHIDLEPENIQIFSKMFDIKNNHDKMKSLPFFSEIVVPDSLSIFHSIHCVYFIFKEVDKEETKRVLKPILKKHDKTKKIFDNDEISKEIGKIHNVTKKVGFSEIENDIKENDRKTRKNHII